MNFLVRAWYKKHPLLYVFLPLAILYQCVIALNRCSYRLGLRQVTHFPVPIIVVGNVTVGGTGKTPLVIALAKLLLSQGYKPGIVSRGYGGKRTLKFPHAVTEKSDTAEVGDEAVLMARSVLCPLVVSADRVAAVTELLKKYDCNVVLSDDGLQHYALGRYIEIAVVDGERRFGNGLCLPAGPLRESVKRLETVDFIVTQGAARKGEYTMVLSPGEIYNLKEPQKKLDRSSLGEFPVVHGVAGIGNPDRFFAQLNALGFRVIMHCFPDHYSFKPEDINFGPDAIVIMTEKDAVKCEKFADSRHWCLPVQANCASMFSELILKKLIAFSRRNLYG